MGRARSTRPVLSEVSRAAVRGRDWGPERRSVTALSSRSWTFGRQSVDV